MAVYLLNGGKMLSEICPKCSAPLFEVKGCKTCVVCEERAKEEKEPDTKPTVKSEAVCPDVKSIVQIQPAYTAKSAGTATPELDNLIASLIRRAQEEKDPVKCLTLLECLRTAAEAKTILARFP